MRFLGPWLVFRFKFHKVIPRTLQSTLEQVRTLGLVSDEGGQGIDIQHNGTGHAVFLAIQRLCSLAPSCNNKLANLLSFVTDLSLFSLCSFIGLQSLLAMSSVQGKSHLKKDLEHSTISSRRLESSLIQPYICKGRITIDIETSWSVEVHEWSFRMSSPREWSFFSILFALRSERRRWTKEQTTSDKPARWFSDLRFEVSFSSMASSLVTCGEVRSSTRDDAVLWFLRSISWTILTHATWYSSPNQADKLC